MQVAALVISFCSWFANKRPDIAGFIVALPLTTILVLLFSYAEHQNSEQIVKFAKSIFVGIPASMTFFVPFLFAEKLDLSFAVCFSSAVGLVMGAFYLHQFVLEKFT